jgi:hypothetical protein
MADKEKYPTIPAKQWWLLRNKFRQSIPPTVTCGYLAAALGMTEESAKHNVLPALFSFKIIDQDGKPTERAKQWRDDEQYPMVCEQILQEIYPSELVHALPPPTPNRKSVERWIANRTGVGESASGKMVSAYLLLCEANPQPGQDVNSTAPAKLVKKVVKAKSSPLDKTPEVVTTDSPASTEHIPTHIPKPKEAIAQSIPSIHIDIQIHISADSSNTQIDQIFASMSKHLGKLINPTDE